MGFWAGQRAKHRTEDSSPSNPPAPSRDPRDDTVDDDDSDNSTEPTDGDISTLKLDSGENCKMVSSIFHMMKVVPRIHTVDLFALGFYSKD